MPTDPRDQRISELEREVAELKRIIEELKKELRKSKRQAARFARNKRVAEPRKAGRPKGHPGARRAVPKQVDDEVFSPLGGCPCCGEEISDVEDVEQFVVEMPEVKPHVTRVVTQRGWCRRCRRNVRSTHPRQTSRAGGAAQVSLGSRALGFAAELKHRLGVTYRKVADLFTHYLGLPVTHGALVQATARLAKAAKPTYQALAQVVRHSPVVHTDDTGWWVNAHAWLWVFATTEVTLYTVDEGRGANVVTELLGADFAGRLVSDGLPALDSLTYKRAQCLGHFAVRASRMEDEQTQGAVRFPRAVKNVVKDAIALAHRHAELAPATMAAYRQDVERRMDKLLAGRIDHSENLKLWNHLLSHRDQLFVSLKDPAVPPTNNLAEQQLRGSVVTRKIGGCNRSWDHASHHAVLASVAQTAHRRRGRLADFVADWLQPNTGPPRDPWTQAAFKRLRLAPPAPTH